MKVLLIAGAARLFINVPVALLLSLAGLCTAGNEFSFECSSSVFEISYSIVTMLQIFMIMLYAPVIVWGVAVATALRNQNVLKEISDNVYQSVLLRRINSSSLYALLLPLSVVVLVMMRAVFVLFKFLK